MVPIVSGGIYLVEDGVLRLPSGEARTVHSERRRFVVISGVTNTEAAWPVVLGCPISGSTTHRTRFDVHLAAGEAGTSKRCWVRVPAVQPLRKVDLQDLTGELDASRLEELYARLLDYLGLTGSPPVEPWEDEPF